ncbi:MAG: DUF2723 domain-containing protein [Nitrospina sp.]|nr:DUF2723 domain-containing protein [Nitrospina sp.]
MNARAVEKYFPFLLPISVFGVYLCTTTPVVYVGDSGEFTAAAFSLGIPHNSGYPLYSLLGKIFCMIPLGNIGFRMALMSASFSAFTILLVYHMILRFTHNVLCSFTAAGFLAFIPLFWFQTVSAEVYPLHGFFVVLMIRLLMHWESTRDFRVLLMFVFVTGLSFGNHMQTVMLAPPVLYFIISEDKRAIFAVRHFFVISIIFMLALTLYLYLPIRTQAGAAIHWGDPDSIERFLAHVTATAHRDAYVFTGGLPQYVSRFLDALKTIGLQYGMLTLFSIWGWIKLPWLRWKIFFVGVIGFDLVYTVFLNVISLEVTLFTLPSAIVMAILLGVGLNNLLDWITGQGNIGGPVRKGVAVALFSIPVVTLITNFGLCDQRRNYTAYEQAINIFRTMDHGSTIFLDGDNNIFPVAYGRIVEGMGEGQQLYDRYNIIFKWSEGKHYPGGEDASGGFKSMVKERIAKEGEKQSLYFAVFNPHAVSIPSDLVLKPYGILRKLDTDKGSAGPDRGCNVWDYYSTESFYDNFARDYMSREVCSFYFFRKAESLFEAGQVAEGLQELRIASLIGYNDTSIHSEIGLLLTDRGFFDEARNEFVKALVYHDDLSGIHNNWGYYYHKTGDYQKAIVSFRKALQLKPDNYTYHNNLGVNLYKSGRKKEALLEFNKSLSINDDQPEIKEYLKTYRFQ